MNNISNIDALTQKLCELKIEERRVCSDIRQLVSKTTPIDFFQARQLNSMRQGVKKNIKSIEAKIMPNIIA